MKNDKAAKNGAAPIDARMGNLPLQPTRLVGRAEELASAHDQAPVHVRTTNQSSPMSGSP
jgi:hypothetical protein